MDVFLGIDLGTTGIRCAAHDADLNTLAYHYVDCPPDYVDERVEQDPRQWWDAVTRATRAVVGELDASARVRSMAVSSQGITVVPVDDEGNALRPAISWLDRRGDEVLDELGQRTDLAALAEATGMAVRPTHTLPKLAWLTKFEPDHASSAAWFLTPHDYIVHRLTGRAITDRTLAGGTRAFDIARGDWRDDALRAAGVTRARMPEVAEAGTRIGALLPGPAAELGLDVDVVVGVGGQDQKCAALAAGIGPEVATLSLGTAAALEWWAADTVAADGPALHPFLFDGSQVREVVVSTAGAAYGWLARAIGAGAGFEDLNAGALASLDDGRARPYFLPRLAAVGAREDRERWGTEPAGVFWGITMATTQGDLALAVLEGVVFDLYAQMRRNPTQVGALRVFGGGARSSLWRQLIADVTGLRVEALATEETASAGAAILAMMACGAVPHDPAAGPRVPTVAVSMPGPHGDELRRRADRHAELTDRIYR